MGGPHRLVQHLNVVGAGGVAHLVRAIPGDENGGKVGAEPVPEFDDRVDAIALIEMVVDEQSIGRVAQRGDRCDGGIEVAGFEHLASPAGKQ